MKCVINARAMRRSLLEWRSGLENQKPEIGRMWFPSPCGSWMYRERKVCTTTTLRCLESSQERIRGRTSSQARAIQIQQRLYGTCLIVKKCKIVWQKVYCVGHDYSKPSTNIEPYQLWQRKAWYLKVSTGTLLTLKLTLIRSQVIMKSVINTREMRRGLEWRSAR